MVIFVAIDKVLKERTQQLGREKDKREEMQQLTEQGELTVLLVVHMTTLKIAFCHFNHCLCYHNLISTM